MAEPSTKREHAAENLLDLQGTMVVLLHNLQRRGKAHDKKLQAHNSRFPVMLLLLYTKTWSIFKISYIISDRYFEG